MVSYRIKRLMFFFMTAIIPSVAMMILILFNFPSLGIILFTLITGIIIAFLGFQMTGTDPWIKVIQGEALGIFAYSSAGVGQFYNAMTKKNSFGGLDIGIDMGGEEEVVSYSKDMTYRVLAPITAIIDSITGKIKGDPKAVKQNYTVIKCPSMDFDKYAWRIGRLTILFYNTEIQTLTSKFDVHNMEREMIQNYLTLNTYRQMREYVKELRLARRNFFDALINKLAAMLKSPLLPVILLVGGLIFFCIVIIMFFPQIQGFLLPAAQNLTNVGTAAMEPITSTGIIK